VKGFREWARNSGWINTARAPIAVANVIVLVFVGGFFLVVLTTMLSVVTSVLAHSTVAVILVPLVILALLAAVGFGAWRAWAGSAATWEKRLRLREFAAARGATYAGYIPAPPYPGMIFELGSD